MTRRDRPPAGPWILGLAGLVPFVFFTAAAAGLAPDPLPLIAKPAFVAYGAVIVSFLGGVRWGFEIGARPDAPSTPVLAAATAPSIVGWLAFLVQMQAADLALGLLAIAFALMWLWDVASSGEGVRRPPNWYPALRTVLTAGVLLSGAVLWWIARG